MNKIQNEHWIDALPGEAVQVANDINIEIAKVIAQRIKKIGELSPSDIKKLSNSLQYLGADFQKITQLIAKYSQKGQTAIVDMLKKAADASDEFANIFYSAKGIAAQTWRTDAYLNSLVEAMARQTVAHFTNLSNTLAYKIDDRTLPLRQMYTQAVDKAIYEVHSGTIDYYTAMRKTIRQLCSDMRVVKWESGYVRRIDSHIRQNMLDGVKQLNQQMMNYHGAKFGADGIELSAHAICAPDHLPAQGRQFSNEEFEKMQSQQPFEDVNGAQYSAFQRPIGEWNCRHFAFPIIIGISEPAYTEEQLKQYADNSTAKYEATQVQRAMETRLRKLKNQRLVQSAAGDELGAKQTQRKINELQTKYRKFSEKNNIAYQPKRATVEGYRRISIKNATKPIDISNRNGIIGNNNVVGSIFDNSTYKPTDISKAIQQEGTNFVTTDINNPEYDYGIAIENVKKIPGVYDIKAHGDFDGIKVFDSAVDAKELARIIISRKDYIGEPIRLLCCNTGKVVNGTCVAQELSNLLGVAVLAPNDIVLTDGKGVLLIGSNRFGSVGEFVRFTPK